MNPSPLNYRHLFYFWLVAKEGSITRAAERAGVAVQTISSQLGLLEKSLGKMLLMPKGRGLVLTEAGRHVLGYADQIFLLGEQMQESLENSDMDSALRLTVGLSNALPKLIAFRLLEAALHLPDRVRLICYEGEFESLLADLALHKLDVVLADRPVSSGTNLRVFSHFLGEGDLMIFGVASLARQYRDGFPASLDGAPMLLPTRNNALRGSLDNWFESHGVRPDVVSEFEDSALLMTFGGSGMGLFPATAALAPDVARQFGAEAVGEIGGVTERFYAISNERRIRHPAVEAIRTATQAVVFSPGE